MSRTTRPSVSARRGPSPLLVVAVVALVLFAGIIGFFVYRAQQGADTVAIPAGGTDTSITVGDAAAPVLVQIYLDFQCPACRAYEQQTGPVVDRLVTAGRIRVEYHPVAYLDRFSTTRYATRSSQASACAADAGVFPAYLRALFTGQPPENSAGLTDDELVALGRQVGAGDGFATCVADGRYAGWTTAVTDAASRAGVTATPTILVDGVEVERSTAALEAAVG